MINLPLPILADLLGTDAEHSAELSFSGVSIDSRTVSEGQLFVAIRGPNFDGHDFVEAARENGAVAALVERKQASSLPQLQVADCRQALGRLANNWRHRCNPMVIALTGSNGKTTVNVMLYRILAARAATLATRGNLNNDLGVPLTLFRLDSAVKFAIIEMGANHRGEIARLADIAQPNVVYVNNAAAAHLAGFGDLQGVVEAKGELYAYCTLPEQALFNADESACENWREICAAQTQMTCALDRSADVTASWSPSQSGVEIDLQHAGETRRCRLQVLGEHNVRNAVAAVSLALLAGIEFAVAVASLDGFSGVEGRLQLLPGPAHSRLLNDSYNANPDSLEAGLKALCSLDGPVWLALGDMAELGDAAADWHRRAGRRARELGVSKLFALGELSCVASAEFGDGGHCCASLDEMAEQILAQARPGVNILVKGSRAAGMERLVTQLTRPREFDAV